jgi:hypothetical protein
MKLYLKIVIIFVVIIIGFLTPRPSLRIESIKSQGIGNKLLIGSSIVDHIAKCGSKTLREEILKFNNWSVAAKAGITPEEVYFIKSRNEGKKNIIIIGLYALLAPTSYNVAKYLYYKKEFKGNFVQKKIWNNDYIAKMVNGEEHVLKIRNTISTKAGESQINNCDNDYKYDNYDEENFKISYWASAQDAKNLIHTNIELLTSGDSTLLLLAPPYEILNDKQKNYIDEIISLVPASTKIRVIKLNLRDFDEPWCNCGHLKDSGIEKIIADLSNVK